MSEIVAFGMGHNSVMFDDGRRDRRLLEVQNGGLSGYDEPIDRTNGMAEDFSSFNVVNQMSPLESKLYDLRLEIGFESMNTHPTIEQRTYYTELQAEETVLGALIDVTELVPENPLDTKRLLDQLEPYDLAVMSFLAHRMVEAAEESGEIPVLPVSVLKQQSEALGDILASPVITLTTGSLAVAGALRDLIDASAKLPAAAEAVMPEDLQQVLAA